MGEAACDSDVLVGLGVGAGAMEAGYQRGVGVPEVVEAPNAAELLLVARELDYQSRYGELEVVATRNLK